MVSPALDGTIAFTRISSDFLISTNFNVDHPSGTYYPCARYTLMTYMLNIITSTENVTIDDCTEVLEAVHVPRWISYPGTLYSNVYDLKRQIIYLYIWGNYEDTVILNLTEELEKGYHGYIINDLAEHSPEELYQEYNLWPIEPKFSDFSLAVILTLTITPALSFSGLWIFVTVKNKKMKKEGGKENGS